MPSSKWRVPSIEAPYTESAAPAVRSRNVRRSMPVPGRQRHPRLDVRQPLAGNRCAAAQELGAVEVVATAAHRHLSAHLHVGGGCDQHAQRVLADRPVRALFPLRRVAVQAECRERARCDAAIPRRAAGCPSRPSRSPSPASRPPSGRSPSRLRRPRVRIGLVRHIVGQFPARLRRRGVKPAR